MMSDPLSDMLTLLDARCLMSGGFFASSAGKGRTQPNQFLWVLWLGAASLAVGVLTLGVGLIVA